MVILTAGFALLLSGSKFALGQQAIPAVGERSEMPNSGAAGSTSGGLSSDTAASRRVGDELLLRTQDGELIPLQEILGTNYSNIVDELLNRIQQQMVVPDYHIADLELTGSIQRDVVYVNADLKIQVNRDHEWVTVPIAFSDLHITDFAHVADSPIARHVPETSDPAQKKWHLYGAGLHTVRLEMIGKTRPQSPSGHSLNLNLPRATQSHALIRFEVPVEIQKLTTEAVEKRQRTDAGVTGIEFWGLDPTFGISWIDVVAQVMRKPVVQVQNNRMKLDLTTIPVTLSGTQTVQVSVSPVSQFHLVLPSGFQLLELVVRNQSGASVLDRYEERPTEFGLAVDVILTSPVEGLLTVMFDLELANRSFPQDISVRLPVLPEANVQSGDLDILIPPGLLVQQTRVEGAQRKRVSTETDMNVASTAFRMRSSDSIVTLHVEEIEAQYAVSPEMEFRPDGSNVLLTARFPVNVLRGSLLDLKLKWPGYATGNWRMLPATTQLVSEKVNVPLSPESSSEAPDSFLLTFPERQSGQFWVEFQAFAPLTEVRAATDAFVCPQVDSRSSEAIVITTIESDDYSLQPIDATTNLALSAAPYRSGATTLKEDELRNSRTWILDPQETPLWFDVTAQAASVTAEMLVGLRPVESGIGVSQQIDFTIEHRDLSAITLVVPEGIQPLVRVEGEDEPLRATLESNNSRSYRLSAARRGDLRLLIEYLVPVVDQQAGREPGIFDLPLVLPQPQSCEMKRCEAGASVSSGLKVRSSADWAPVFSERFEAAWVVQGPVSSIPIQQRSAVLFEDSVSPAFVVSRSTLTGSEAITRTLAVLASQPKEFSFRVPEGTMPKQVLINGASVNKSARVFDQKSGGYVTWIVSFTEFTAGDSLGSGETKPCSIEVITRQQISRRSSLANRIQLARPRFGADTIPLPTIWLFETQENLRVVSDGRQQSITDRSMLSILRRSSASVAAIREIDSLLSTCSSDVQLVVRDHVDEWLHASNPSPEAFFLMSDTEGLSVYLIPRVSLLLVSALVCVLCFGMMSMLRSTSMMVPVMFSAAAIPAVYLIWPEWTVVLLPYVMIGTLLGLVSLMFQKATGASGMRLRSRGRSADVLTIFGMSGFLNDSSAADRSDLIVSSRSDVLDSGIR